MQPLGGPALFLYLKKPLCGSMITIYRIKFPKENILVDGSEEYSEISQVLGTHNPFSCKPVYIGFPPN